MDMDDDDFSATSFVPYSTDWKEGDDVPAAILIKTAHLKRLRNIYRMLWFLRIEKDDELTFTEIVDIESSQTQHPYCSTSRFHRSSSDCDNFSANFPKVRTSMGLK